MTSENQNKIEELRGRVAEAERKLRTIKFILVAVGIVVLVLMNPLIAAVVGVGFSFVIIVVGIIVYAYFIIWVCDRIFVIGKPRKQETGHSFRGCAAANLLEELLERTPSRRHDNLGDPELRKALEALVPDNSIAWLEKYIVSPVTFEWAWLLYDLKPQWHHLDRWMRLSKTHALAAVDVLLRFSDVDSLFNDEISPKLPPGANPELINESLDFVLANYGNPRLREAAKKIRHVWPVGSQTRHSINVTTNLKHVAEILLRHNSDLYDEWHESMVTALKPATNPFDIWDSLLYFAARKELVAIVDWKECPEEIIAWLQSLPPADVIDVRWEQFEEFEGDNESLLNAIGIAIRGQGQILVSLDHGSGDYVLAFLPSDHVSEVETSIASFENSSMKVEAYR